MDTERVSRAFAVLLDGERADAEEAGNLLAGQAGDDIADDFGLARAEIVPRERRYRRYRRFGAFGAFGGLAGDGDETGGGMQPELVQDARTVLANSEFGEAEFGGAFGAGETSSGQVEDLEFSGG